MNTRVTPKQYSELANAVAAMRQEGQSQFQIRTTCSQQPWAAGIDHADMEWAVEGLAECWDSLQTYPPEDPRHTPR